MALDDDVYVVRLLEVLIDDITIDESRQITWPKLFGEENVPTIHGALILYDVTNGESVIEVPDVLCESGSIHAFSLLKAAPILIFQFHVQCPAAPHHRR
jgi:N-glycosylase/DNA lyase